MPFRRGVVDDGQRVGGMPDDFQTAEHNLQSLKVESVNGAIFASFDPTMPPVREYLGELMTHYFERVFDGRPLRLLGRVSQKIARQLEADGGEYQGPLPRESSARLPGLVWPVPRGSEVESRDGRDRPARRAGIAQGRAEDSRKRPRTWRTSRPITSCYDPSLLAGRKEFKDENTVVMQTIFPGLIVQQQTNTLAMRQIVPNGPDAFDLVWDFFGYADDDEAIAELRLKQANLMGPSGLVSVDDTEVLELCQKGFRECPDQSALVELGGRDYRNENHMVTETAIRGMYKFYREIMQF